MRIAVTGKVGQVVSALVERGLHAAVEVVPVGRPDLDLAVDVPLYDVFARIAPDAIISAAAYTAVDKAESEPELAAAINAGGAERVARAATQLGVPIVHLSTDYVFEGSKSSPYVETDATGPLGVYGRTKLAGERALALAQPNHAILRTAWVYSPFGNNFLKTMLRLAASQPELRVVADQLGNPTSALDIADAALSVTRNLLASPNDSNLRGVFHMVGQGEASWADFARGIVDEAGRHGRNHPNVVSITTADYPTPAQRPANSRLATDKLRQRHGVVLPQWQASMRQTVARLVGTNA